MDSLSTVGQSRVVLCTVYMFIGVSHVVLTMSLIVVCFYCICSVLHQHGKLFSLWNNEVNQSIN